jgi:hypothetical protein
MKNAHKIRVRSGSSGALKATAPYLWAYSGSGVLCRQPALSCSSRRSRRRLGGVYVSRDHDAGAHQCPSHPDPERPAHLELHARLRARYHADLELINSYVLDPHDRRGIQQQVMQFLIFVCIRADFRGRQPATPAATIKPCASPDSLHRRPGGSYRW